MTIFKKTIFDEKKLYNIVNYIQREFEDDKNDVNILERLGKKKNYEDSSKNCFIKDEKKNPFIRKNINLFDNEILKKCKRDKINENQNTYKPEYGEILKKINLLENQKKFPYDYELEKKSFAKDNFFQTNYLNNSSTSLNLDYKVNILFSEIENKTFENKPNFSIKKLSYLDSYILDSKKTENKNTESFSNTFDGNKSTLSVKEEKEDFCGDLEKFENKVDLYTDKKFNLILKENFEKNLYTSEFLYKHQPSLKNDNFNYNQNKGKINKKSKITKNKNNFLSNYHIKNIEYATTDNNSLLNEEMKNKIGKNINLFEKIKKDESSKTSKELDNDTIDFDISLEENPCNKSKFDNMISESKIKLLEEKFENKTFQKADFIDNSCCICDLSLFSNKEEKNEKLEISGNEMENKKVFTLPCNHSFHKTCFIQWYNIKKVCPLCRFKIEIEFDFPIKNNTLKYFNINQNMQNLEKINSDFKINKDLYEKSF